MDLRIYSPRNIVQQLPRRRRIGPKELIDDQDVHKVHRDIELQNSASAETTTLAPVLCSDPGAAYYPRLMHHFRCIFPRIPFEIGMRGENLVGLGYDPNSLETIETISVST